MQKQFTRDNLEIFVKSFMNDSLLPFLNSGYLDDDQKLRLTAPASQVNANEFIVELNDKQAEMKRAFLEFQLFRLYNKNYYVVRFHVQY